MPSIRELMRITLENIGFKNIIEAADGKQGLDILNSHKDSGSPIDLVISDWNMPKMMGIQLLKAVRNQPDWEDLPFIILTTESEKVNILEAVATGVSDYIVKPFSQKLLESKLRAVHHRLNGTLTNLQKKAE